MATQIEDGASPQDVRGEAVHPLLNLLVAYSWRLIVVFLAVPFTAVVVNMVAVGRDYGARNPDDKLVAAE